MKIILVLFFPILLSLLSTGCASMQSLDRSYANHPAMDLRMNQTPSASSSLTTLGALTRQNMESGCATCAK